MSDSNHWRELLEASQANHSIGHHCVIDPDVEIGEGTHIGSFVELRRGTRIGRNCVIDSYVVTSGNCVIEDNCTLRYGTVIARGCHVEHDSYLAPRTMTNNLNHNREPIGGARIGAGSFIGTHAVLAAGITIAPETVVGSCAFVAKSIDEPGVYVGVPARRIK